MADVKRHFALLRLAALVAIFVAAVILLPRTPLGAYLSREGIYRVIDTIKESTWAPLIYIGVYAGATGLAVPGSFLTLAGGAVFGLVGGTIFTTIAANIGASLAFLLARSLGREGIVRVLGSRLQGLDKGAREHGFRGLLVLRLVPLVPFNALNFGAGLTALRWKTYALATAIGIFPGTVVYTFFADALLEGSREASRQALIRVLIAGALLVLLSLTPVILKRMRIRIPGQTALLAALLPGGALSAQIPDPGTFTQVLQPVVAGQRVDYQHLKANRAGLDEYLAALHRLTEPEVRGAGRSIQLAFWINAYNACMLRLVIDNYPIEKASFPRSFVNSIAGRPANSVWQIADVFKGPHCPIAGKDRSLDEIEHQIIRPLGEPRIHFAVNCAARSCPALASHAFTPDSLHAQLDERVRGFVADPAQLRIERTSQPVVHLNKVLDWFGEDFGGEGGVRKFLAPYLAQRDRTLILDPDTPIEYLDYDWTLNDIDR